MGILKELFGGKPAKGRAGAPPPPQPAGGGAGAMDQLIGELQREGRSGPRVAEVTVDSSPKQVCRYVFQRLMAGTPAAGLRAELVSRGFAGKVADGYIQLIQSTLFKGR
ncbi:MAG: hypothetical protein ABIL09_03660 [Gemmatimonadota bacterium]